MAKLYNDKSHKFSDWTTKKLKYEAIGYHQSIYEIGCYGVKDLMNYYAIVYELENRGFTVGENLVIYKN